MCMTLSFQTFASESEAIGDQVVNRFSRCFQEFYETAKKIKMIVPKARELVERVNLDYYVAAHHSFLGSNSDAGNSNYSMERQNLMMT